MFSDFDISIVIRILKKQKLIIVQALIVCLLVAGWMSFHRTTRYYSNVNIQLKSEKKNMPNLGFDTGNSSGSAASELEREQYYIKSKMFLEKVIDKIFPALKKDEKKMKILQLQRNITCENIEQADLLQIFFSSGVKDNLITILNSIADQYIEDKKEQSLASVNSKIELIEKLLKEREIKLRESEEIIRNYQEQKRVFDMEGK